MEKSIKSIVNWVFHVVNTKRTAAVINRGWTDW